MQYQDTYCSGARVAALEDDLVCLWPSNAVDDIIRRKLASILLEDPDHRLRVAHLEPLLQLSLGQRTPCSSGRLQALLTDPTTAKYFPVDFNVQVADWRSRVVYLDMALLLQSLSAAKHQHLQQQAGAAASDRDEAAHMQRGSSNGCSTAAALESHLLVPDDTASSGTEPSQQQQRAASSNGSHRPAPLALGSIFGSNPAFGRASSVGGSVCSAGGAQHHSHSVPCPAGNSSAGAAGAPPSSLFGGSFEVPHAIASCWADPHSSFDSGVVKHQALEALTAADGCGSSSMASGSSAHSFAAAQNAAGTAGGASAAATRPVTGGSRLRNASTCVQEGADGTTEPAAANSIDVCTPRSGIAAPGAMDRSPLHSGECEEDAEYSEAQLVFGSINAAAGSNTLAATAAATTGLADDDRSGQGGTGPREETSPASGGAEGAAALEAQGSFNMQGMDWSCMATLQQQQAEAAYNQQRSQSQAQQPLLFGLDDFAAEGLTPRSSSGGGAGATPSAAAAAARARSSALAAAATGALTARRLLMEHAGLREDCSTISSALLGGSHSPHHLAALAGSLGAIGAGSAPGNLQQQQQHEQLLLAAAAAVGSSGGFGGYGGSFNSAAGAERLLLDADGMSYGLSGSQQHMAALGSLQGTSYSSGGLLSERSGSGFWASPAAMQQQFLLQHHQQQQQRQQAVAAAAVAAAAAAAQSQQQQQQMRGSLGGGDGAVDVGVRSDQLLKDNSVGSMGRNGATPGKPANGVGSQPAGALGGGQGSHGAQTHHDLAAERSTGGGSGATGSALTPRLTGWASIAAKEPPASAALQQQQQQVVMAGAGSGTQGGVKQPQQQGAVDGTLGKAVAKLPSRVKVEVQNLVTQFQGVLKLEDFDDGVVHQLNAKRTEDEAIAAVRHIAHYELGTIQHMAAYLNHLVKHYNHNAAAAAAAAAAADSSAGLSNALAAAAVAAVAANSAAAHGGSTAAMQQLLGAGMLGGNGTLGSTIGSSRVSGGGVGGGGVAGLGAYGGQIRLASVPVSTKAMLQKLPLKVFKQIELLVQNCAYLEWRHFDAGVIKVLSQLSKLCEGDVFDELELLAATDLSNVEYMPAYLNKRLNNKLWSRRKAEGHVPN